MGYGKDIVFSYRSHNEQIKSLSKLIKEMALCLKLKHKDHELIKEILNRPEVKEIMEMDEYYFR